MVDKVVYKVGDKNVYVLDWISVYEGVYVRLIGLIAGVKRGVMGVIYVLYLLCYVKGIYELREGLLGV